MGSGDVDCEGLEGVNSGVKFWVGLELLSHLTLSRAGFYLRFDDLIMDKGLHFTQVALIR